MSSFLNLVLRDSVLQSPFVPKRNFNGAAVANVFDSFLGGLFGMATTDMSNAVNKEIAQKNYDAQMKTNELNERLAREQNSYNRSMLEYQNAYNERMWDKQNVYNSPSAQMQRLKEAGLNPSLAIGGQFGNAGQLQSGEPKPAERAQMVAPQLNYQYQPYDFSSFAQSGNAVNAYYQAKLMDSEAKKNFSTSGNLEILS